MDELPNPAELTFEAADVHPSAFLADGSIVRGKVTIGELSSVWFHAVIRADTEVVCVGSCTNIQDGCVLHADAGFPCIVGDRVTVGHRAIVHGANVADEVMIGMGAIVLNGARVGRGSIVAAGSLVPEGMEIPENSLLMGVPAKVRRQVSDAEVERIRHAAEHYVAMAKLWGI